MTCPTCGESMTKVGEVARYHRVMVRHCPRCGTLTSTRLTVPGAGQFQHEYNPTPDTVVPEVAKRGGVRR